MVGLAARRLIWSFIGLQGVSVWRIVNGKSAETYGDFQTRLDDAEQNMLLLLVPPRRQRFRRFRYRFGWPGIYSTDLV